LESLEGIGSILSMNNDFLGSVEGAVKKQKKRREIPYGILYKEQLKRKKKKKKL